MTAVFAIVLVIHGLIHLLGFAKAFGLADLPQLTQPVPSVLGLLWLLAAFLFLATAAALFVWPTGPGRCARSTSLIGWSGATRAIA